MAVPFAPTVQPNDPHLTAVVVEGLLAFVKAGDAVKAVEALRHVETAAGRDYANQLRDYLIGLGLEFMLSTAAA